MRPGPSDAIRVVPEVELEYSAFAVDGRPDLGMFVYNPATCSDADRIRALVASAPGTT